MFNPLNKFDMEDMMRLQEKSSKEIKNVSTTYQGYDLDATATIENGKIINMNGHVVNNNDMGAYENVRFDCFRQGDELKTTYYNFASDDRAILDIFNKLIDCAIAMYEV